MGKCVDELYPLVCRRMDVYLNEWSLRDSKDIVENWTAIKNFNALFGKLAKAGNLCFYAPENLWDIPISGFNVKTGVRLDGRGVPKEHSMLLRTIYGKFSIIKDGLPYFSKSEEMVMPSATMGLAAENSAPVISFAFDEEYRVDFFSGWVKHLDNSVERARVNNVFEEKPSNYELIVDLSLCRKLNPLDEPMWNSGRWKIY